jgi:hypothetical protein
MCLVIGALCAPFLRARAHGRATAEPTNGPECNGEVRGRCHGVVSETWGDCTWTVIFSWEWRGVSGARPASPDIERNDASIWLGRRHFDTALAYGWC